MLLSQADATQVIARAPVKLDELVTEITAVMARQSRKHRFEPQITRGLVVQGDHGRLTQALRNLLENAVRYTPPRTVVSVCLVAQINGQAHITVADSGPEIAAEHLPHPAAARLSLLAVAVQASVPHLKTNSRKRLWEQSF